MRSAEQLQTDLDLWLERLKQVDSVLGKPANTLIGIYDLWTQRKSDADFPTAPTYLTENDRSHAKALLIHAVTCSTLQRLAQKRRRFPWLTAASKKTLEKLDETIAEPFLPKLDPSDPLKMIVEFEDNVFGALNPLAATEVFWVLIQSGERNAHRGPGFLMLFSILWSLGRKFGRPADRGARLDPWWPTASITAKCLFLIRTLQSIINKRGRQYEKVRGALKDLANNAGGSRQSERWRFTIAMESLSRAIHDQAELAIERDELVRSAHELSERAATIGPETPTSPIWDSIRAEAGRILLRLAATNEEVLRDAAQLNELLLKEIVRRVENEDTREAFAHDYCKQLQFDQIRLEQQPEYWQDAASAAASAQKTCESLIDTLRQGVDACKPLRGVALPDFAVLETVLTDLANMNFKVAEQLYQTVKPNLEWMPSVMTRHIAFASAGDFTYFDPAELLSAVSIAERWRNLSDIEARDAIQKAAERGRGDGSWSTSQPIYVIKRVHGVWPSTPDVAWLLASAVAGRPNITEGDEALFRFVGWLEKTGVDLQGERSGWSSESREEDLIDLWATAVSINALVEIREIIEYRLWQLCEERFLVRRGRDLRALDEIDPVDLGAIHAQRLHRRLMVMARETAQEHVQSLKPAEPPEYAFVLHGPPGSSKTAIAEALGSEMWRSQKASRFVRITPADFTRGGEVRLDREARFIFDLLTHVRGVTIFFDEIDDLLRQRAFGAEPHFIKLLVPAMLNRLQDLRDAAPRQEICFLLATNYIDNIEPALTRPGRIDAAIPVPYPDAWSREAILENKLGKRSIDDAVKNAIVERTAGWPWSTYKRLCDKIAAMKTVDWDEVSAQIEHLATAFESSDFYYFVPKRWASGSHPLMHEFIRVSFSFSKDRNTNRRKVDDLVSLLEKSPDVNLARLPFASAFDAEWRRTRGQ